VDKKRHSPAYTAEQAQIAMNNGADGVILCAWPASVRRMVKALRKVREALPTALIGANFLCHPEELREVALGSVCDMLWTDAGVNGEGVEAELTDLRSVLRAQDFRGLLLGSFAFKHRAEMSEADMPAFSSDALRLMDVQTTSGPSTGVAMAPAKAGAVRAALGKDAVIAIASGVTMDNVTAFLPFVDVFVVGTGVEAERPLPMIGSDAEAVAAHEAFVAAVRGAVASSEPDPRAAPAESELRRIVELELGWKLASTFSIAFESRSGPCTPFTHRLLRSWVGETGALAADQLSWLWERAVARAATGRAELAANDGRYHREYTVATYGASELVIPGKLDASRVATLAKRIHA
jgi:hypothetical protein